MTARVSPIRIRAVIEGIAQAGLPVSRVQVTRDGDVIVETAERNDAKGDELERWIRDHDPAA